MDTIEKFVRDRDLKMPSFGESWNQGTSSAYGLSLDVWNTMTGKEKENTKTSPKSPKSPTPPSKYSKTLSFIESISPKHSDHHHGKNHHSHNLKSPHDPLKHPAFEKIVSGITNNLQHLKAYSPMDTSSSSSSSGTSGSGKIPQKKNSRWTDCELTRLKKSAALNQINQSITLVVVELTLWKWSQTKPNLFWTKQKKVYFSKKHLLSFQNYLFFLPLLLFPQI